MQLLSVFRILLVLGLVSSLNFVHCQEPVDPLVVEATTDNVQEIIDTNLIVFLIENDISCQTDTKTFEDVAKISHQVGLQKLLDMKFVKLFKKGNKKDCGWPTMILYRYGRAIPYGSKNFGVILTQESLTTIGIIKWLEKNTKPAVEIIQNSEELQGFVANTNSTIIGHFEERSKAKVVFWSVADKLKDYAWASSTNKSINVYGTGDTIVINNNFGAEHFILNKALTAATIENIVSMNAIPTPIPPPPSVEEGVTSPIIEITENSTTNSTNETLYY